jgi:hypothetical protein
MMKSRRASMFVLCAAAVIALLSTHMARSDSPPSARDINSVLAAHDKQLLAMPNVVGVYVGVLRDGKTPCLKVMLAKASAETQAAIPHTIDGFAVVVEVTGPIKPLQKR